MADGTIAAAYISGAFTVSAAILAFGPVAFQIWRQGKLNREAAIEADISRFKTELYRDGVQVARALSDAASGFNGHLRSAEVQVTIASLAARDGHPVPLPSNRFPEIMRFNREVSDALLQLVYLVEERRIFDPRLLIFRDALNTASHELREAFGRDAQWSLMQAMPTELPNGQLHPYTPLGEEPLSKFKRVIDGMTEALSDISMYAGDFIVELQNVLLGEIFGNEVAHREPLDPERRVIRLEDHDELKKWIEGTPWGKECARIEERVRQQIAEKAEAAGNGTPE